MIKEIESDQYGTPAWLINRARAVFLDRIDFDPASNHEAQKIVHARDYCTIENDGLNCSWWGNVWLNPPYSRGIIDKFVDKAVYESWWNHTENMLVLVNNKTETRWFHKLLAHARAMVFFNKRINFLLNGIEQPNPRQGQVLFYFHTGDNQQNGEFINTFYDVGFGVILQRGDE